MGRSSLAGVLRKLGAALCASALLAGFTPSTAGAVNVTATVYYDQLISQSTAGTQSASAATTPALSSTGNFVAFATTGGLGLTNTNGGIDNNGLLDVYRRDVANGTTQIVSTDSNTNGNAAGNSGMQSLDISDDGSTVVFLSDASTIVPGPVPLGSRNIYARNFSTNSMQIVNLDSAGNQLPLRGSGYFAASADGTKVAFLGQASAVMGTTQGIYIRDLTAQTTTFAYYADDGQIAMSGDGTHIAYARVGNVTPGGGCPSGIVTELYIWHFDTVNNISVAVRANAGTSSNFCDFAGVLGPNALSANGDDLAFWSDGDAWGENTPGNTTIDPKPRYVFSFKESTDALEIISEPGVNPSGTIANRADNDSAPVGGGPANSAVLPAGSISADGRKVSFPSLATNIDPSATHGGAFVKNRDTGVLKAYSLSDVDFTAAPVVDTAMNSAGDVVGFSTAQSMTPADTNGATDVFTRSTSAPTSAGALAPANVALTATPTSNYPGFSALPSSAVPAASLPLDALNDVAGAPLRSVDLASSPLRSVPLRSVPLRSVPLRSVPLRSITLSELPLLSGTWDTILAGLNPNPFVGVPLENITLDQVLAAFDAQPSASSINSVTLGNIDLASTPLRSVSIASLLLGATPLRSVQIGASAPPNSFTDWCTALAALGYSCADLGLTGDSPVLAVDLAGVPLRSVPLRSVPLRSVPLRSVDVGSAPLRSVPLRSVQYSGDLGSMLLDKIRDINPDGSLGASDPGLLVNCADPDAGLFGSCAAPRTLTNATTADAFLSGKTFGDLIDHVAPADITGTLGDFIAAIIDTSNYPWESLGLDGLQPLAGTNARTVEFTSHFETTGAGTGTATVAVDLPPGFLYKNFSTVDHDDTYSEPTVTGGHLVWTVPNVAGGETHDIVFDAYPNFDLATNAASHISVAIGAQTAQANGTPVSVLEDFETALCTTCITGVTLYHVNDVPSGAVEVQPNTMVASHIGEPGDVDYFKLAVPPKGTRIQVRLGNHSTDADFDVVMFNSTTDSTPLRSVPLRSVPLRSVPLADNGIDATAAQDAVSPETLDDIPNVEGAPLRSVGENRGTADELLSTVSDADPLSVPPPGTEFGSQQYYLLQVTAYNNGSSKSPYVLYVKEYAPPPPPVCPSPKAYPYTGTAGSAPASLPANLNTLFLVDQKRMGATYGATAAQQVIDKLTTLSGRADLGVTGVVYPVESNSTAATALDNWDLDPCNPDAANRAFNAVGAIVDGVRAQRPTLKNIVVVGGDDILPMARVADYTQISNESDYGTSLLLANGPNTGTPMAASALTQNILTDDPLADTDPIPWLDHSLYVPDLAVGRMVETPTEIIGQVDSFLAANGVLNPQTSLSTGYDFLADGADSVDTALANRITDPTKRTKLINETWSKADVLAALYPATGSPGVIDVNAHYDHTRSLPALGNSTGDESDLVSTADIASHPNLTRRLLFTMGCHAGLSVPKAYTDTAAKDADWAQTYSAKQAAVYFANTGFGYGDTAAVALSEEVMRQFALRLDGSMTVGQAAVYAKQAYFGQLGAYGPYDEKAMQEATFYGLPMWKVGTTGPTPPTPQNVTPTPDATGVLSAPISVSPSFTKKTSKGGGTYFTAGAANVAASGLQVTQYRPIEPRLSVDVTPASGLAHGVLITSLASHDEAVVPAMARPVIDLTASEPPPPAGEVAFPTNFSNLTTFNTPQGQRQHAVLLPGQFFRDAAFEGAGGVQRLFDSIGAEVKYSDSTDFLAPQLTDVSATLSGGQLTINLDAFDETQNGVKRVVVLVKDQTNAWSLHELTDPEGDGSFTTGPFPVVGTQIEYFAQAQDGAGNVGVTTNKGRYFSGLPSALTSSGTPSLSLTPSQPTGSNGWYRTNVAVALQGTLGVTYTKSVDGGAPTAYSSPVSLTTDGPHSVKAFGNDGSSAIAVAVIDKTAPTLTATPDRAPNANGWYNAPVTFAVSCADATSGVQVCPPSKAYSAEGTAVSIGTAFDFAGNSKAGPTVNLDMTPPTVNIGGVANGAVYNGVAPDPTCSVADSLSGPAGCTGVITNGPGAGYYTYTATGTDRAGNTRTVSATYKASYLFGGFLQPVNDTAHFVGLSTSVFAAGSTVPLKFKLVKQDGTSVQATSTPTFIAPVRIGPLAGAAVNEQTVNATATSSNLFTWDPSSKSYYFNWKTDKKSMAGYYWRIGVLVDGQAFTVIIGLK